MERKPWRIKNNEADDPNKLHLPLLKGYDDYDKELKELFGDDRDKLLNLIDSQANKNAKQMKLMTPEDLESAKDISSPPQELMAYDDYNSKQKAA